MNSRIRKLVDAILHNPIAIINQIMVRIPWVVSDKTFVKIQYRTYMKNSLNLKNPQSYTEKLQWLKLYDHNPLYTQIVDKVLVKDYVAKLIGEEHIIPTLNVWDDANQIDFSKLPNQFVLKCNHGGGGHVFICKDKSIFDIKGVKRNLNKQLRSSTFLRTREWPYKNIERKILCEQYMEDESGELRDYKFYCFDGDAKFLLVASNRFTTHNFNYYDMNFNPLPLVSADGENSTAKIDKPIRFEEMKDIVSKLAKGFVHVRVDLYYCHNQIYFGELTLYDSSGFDDLNSDEWNNKMGSWIDLSKVQRY